MRRNCSWSCSVAYKNQRVKSDVREVANLLAVALTGAVGSFPKGNYNSVKCIVDVTIISKNRYYISMSRRCFYMRAD